MQLLHVLSPLTNGYALGSSRAAPCRAVLLSGLTQRVRRPWCLYLFARRGAAYAAAMLIDLLPLATYCLLMSGTPGPNNVMLTASGANFGFRGSLPHILGISIGGAVQAFATCLGLGALFVAFPVLHSVLRVAGALYLLYLAWKLTGGMMGEAQVARPLTLREGALFQAINPKSWMKAVTLASVFMPVGWPPLQGALLVAVVGFVVGIPCTSAWALFGVAIRRLLEDPRRRRIFNAMMATTLALLALMFLR